jgi:hypothetical protein
VRKTIIAAALFVVAVSTSCITLPVTSTVVTQPGRRVTAVAETFSALWLSPLPAETTSDLLDDLVEQCNGADLTGVTVMTETGFAVIGQTEKIVVSGYCVEPGGSDFDDGDL